MIALRCAENVKLSLTHILSLPLQVTPFPYPVLETPAACTLSFPSAPFEEPPPLEPHKDLILQAIQPSYQPVEKEQSPSSYASNSPSKPKLELAKSTMTIPRTNLGER